MRFIPIAVLLLVLGMDINFCSADTPSLPNPSSPSHSLPSPSLPEIGKPFAAADFSLPADDGKIYRLSDYKGKVVILNFWATWCPPCRREMPSLEKLWQKIKNQDMVVLAINVGENADTIFEFTGNYPVSFPLLMDKDGKVIKDYPAQGLPTTYIIDPRGIVTHRAVGGREWDDAAILTQLQTLRKP